MKNKKIPDNLLFGPFPLYNFVMTRAFLEAGSAFVFRQGKHLLVHPLLEDGSRTGFRKLVLH